MIRSRSILGALALLLLVPLATTGPGVVAAGPTPDTSGSIATFAGGEIDLRDGWGRAQACTTDGSTTRCYRSEAAMDRVEGSILAAADVTPFAVCSTSVRLYRSTSYGGAVLQLTTRGSYLNLSAYGFDNDTSSYKIGACNSTFYDGASGGAPTYPGSTAANASATSMSSGWDNRVSSVYIA